LAVISKYICFEVLQAAILPSFFEMFKDEMKEVREAAVLAVVQLLEIYGIEKVVLFAPLLERATQDIK